MDPAMGRGWAKLEDDGLSGMIFFHLGDESGFEAERAESKKPRKKRK